MGRHKKIERVKATNMTSPRGTTVPNQIEIRTPKGVYFQSYRSTIAFIPNEGQIVLGEDWDYSKTTGIYRNMFLGENKAQTQAKLDSGEYRLDKNL